MAAYNYAHLTAAGNYALSPNSCVLHSITVNNNTATAGTMSVYDGTSASGTPVAIINFAGSFFSTGLYDVICRQGISVVVSAITGTLDVTVSFG